MRQNLNYLKPSYFRSFFDLACSFHRGRFWGKSIAFCFIAFSALAGFAHAQTPEADILRQSLRAAQHNIAVDPIGELNLSDLFPCGLTDASAVLGQIGLAQLDLEDLNGARITAFAISRVQKDSSGRESSALFLAELAVAEARAGNVESAFRLLNYNNRGYGFGGVLALAREQGAGGHFAGAKRTCDLAKLVCNTSGSLSDLLKIACVQAAIGDHDSARQVLEYATPIVEHIASNRVSRAHLMGLLGLLNAKLGNLSQANRHLRNAVLLLESKAPTDGEARLAPTWRVLANIYLTLGDVQRAVRCASSAEGDIRTQTFCDLAMSLCMTRRFDAAEEMIPRLAGDPDVADELLAEIANSRVQAGACNKGIATAARISRDSTRAQVTLGIATTLARQGRHDQALALARAIKVPEIIRGGRRVHFEFESPKTWTIKYESTAGGIHSEIGTFDTQDELSTAALHCWIALHGSHTAPYSVVIENCWNLRKLAACLAREGELQRALEWAQGVSRTNRLLIVLGVVDGLTEKLGVTQPTSIPRGGLHKHLLEAKSGYARKVLPID